MISAVMTSHANFDEWRDIARRLLQNNIHPKEVEWSGVDRGNSLFSAACTSASELPLGSGTIKTSKAFIETAKRAICHRDPERFARLYNILWRSQHETALIKNSVDPDILWLTSCDKAVRRDRHKMHAFVRFKKVGMGRFHREQFAAWFEPSHYITELAAPFFMRRFPNMDWVIVTPEASATWDGTTLKFGPGGVKSDVPKDDAVEDQWQTYFASIFNPARLKVGAMMSEMPKKYWKNMPEAAQIPSLIQAAQLREQQMRTSGVTPANPLAARLREQNKRELSRSSVETLDDIRSALQNCKRCPLYAQASQAVPGEGPKRAKIMIIGEQPADQEDIAGRPFTGPAGQVLNDALLQAGIKRSDAYVTNAVKHFKFKARGKRRIHERPNAAEIDHCRPWLNAERDIVKPEIIIALGASAARSILGRSVKISEMRGRDHILKTGERLFVTVHPSYLLRLPTQALQSKERNAFIKDLRQAQKALAETGVKNNSLPVPHENGKISFGGA